MDLRSGRGTDAKGLDEESETLLKDSDTQESSAGGHCSLLSTDICGTMFRSRHDHDKTAQAGHNKDVSIPLVRDREVDEAAAIKRKTSSAKASTVDESQVDEAVQAQENKRRKRRIMKFAVYIMFGIIALGVFAIWLFHKDAVESIRFGSNFIFTVKVRTLELKLEDQKGMLYGELGHYLKATQVEKCKDGEENCLHWKSMAYLRVSQNDNTTGSCYTLHWQGLSQKFLAQDCFYLQKFNWYGYLVPNQPFWPIRGVQVSDFPFYSRYPAQQTVNLVPSWLGSQGIAIFVDSSFPVKVSWNTTEKRQFCITSDLGVYVQTDEEEEGVEQPIPVIDKIEGTAVDQLTYTICQAHNIKDVYLKAQRYRQDMEVELQKKSHTIQPLAWPIYTVNSSQDVTKMISMLKTNQTQCSFLELPATWERSFGDLKFDPEQIDNLQKLMNEAKAGGCGIVLPLSTFFTFNSHHFQTGIRHHYFLRDELDLVTKMVRWREQEGAVLDTTNHEAVHWYLGLVKQLLANYSVHALKLLHIDVPRDANFYDVNVTFLDNSRLFYRDASLLLNITLFLEQATGFVSEPVFLPLAAELHEIEGAQCFKSVISWALHLGVSGYPLVVADATDLLTSTKLNDDLLERWLQLSMFFPALQIPNQLLISNSAIMHMLRPLLEMRQQEILPYMVKEWAVHREAPILRPLWWLDPQDLQAQLVSDQFLVGDDLLVAPILCSNTSSRSVYLPAGKWKDKYGSVKSGLQTIHVDSEHVPYFWKVT